MPPAKPVYPVPGPRWHFPAGNLTALWPDPPAYLRRLHARYGNVVRFHLGATAVYLLSDLGHIDHVLRAGAKRYRKSASYDQLKLIFGNGMLVADGDTWAAQRHRAHGLFTPAKVAEFASVACTEAAALFARWEAGGPAPATSSPT